jgi:hypothetical protein
MLYLLGPVGLGHSLLKIKLEATDESKRARVTKYVASKV